MSECPVCEADVTFEGEVVPHELISCPECAGDLEVVSVDPLVLSEAPEEAEDWGE